MKRRVPFTIHITRLGPGYTIRPGVVMTVEGPTHLEAIQVASRWIVEEMSR